MFTPAWKKNAEHLVRGARKFLNYKRDLLTDEKIAEIESRRDDLVKAIKLKDKAKVDEASKQLRATCEHSLPRLKPQGWFEENVEVMFVAIVIALGLRAYYLQPFRIPTGSMQPTLNGIVGTQLKKEEWPSLPVRMVEWVLMGRSYAHVKADKDLKIAISSSGIPLMRDFQFMHFFSRSEIYFEDSSPTLISRMLGTDPLRLPAPLNPMYEVGLVDALQTASSKNRVIPAGTTIAEGFIDTGDLVLVDKFSYHFRKPKRGEVFVFDTLGIKGIQEHSGPQGGGSHYIKRLVGVPGDEISIKEPNLIVNGQKAGESQIQKVAEGKPPFSDKHKGYVLAQASLEHQRYLVQGDDVMKLKGKGADPGMREYAAMGDNTGNSLDSRYWGTVKEYNLVGPALFSLWPIQTGHWGLIK
jgi:signal peptidase I